MDSTKTGVIARAYVETLSRHIFEGPDGFSPDALTIEQAYRVQDTAFAHRTDAGDESYGYKVGCTSAPIRKQFGLNEPIRGRLYKSELRRVAEDKGGTVAPVDISFADFVDLAIEPEFALTVGDVEGPDVSVASVAPAIELHNFRFWSGAPQVKS